MKHARAGTGRGKRVVITHDAEVDDATAEKLYAIYQDAFGPLQSLSAARQVLHHDEFFEIIEDPRVFKVLGWRGGEPVAVAALTNTLETVPWISPEYYRRLYPEHAARNAIYYLPLAFVGPARRGEHLLDQLLVDIAERLIALDAVCGYDLCAYNNHTFAFADRIESALQTVTAIDAGVLDTQTFYAVRAI